MGVREGAGRTACGSLQQQQQGAPTPHTVRTPWPSPAHQSIGCPSWSWSSAKSLYRPCSSAESAHLHTHTRTCTCACRRLVRTCQAQGSSLLANHARLPARLPAQPQSLPRSLTHNAHSITKQHSITHTHTVGLSYTRHTYLWLITMSASGSMPAARSLAHSAVS